MATKVIMPQLGESVVEGTVSKWFKGEGDTIEELESLLEVNTDKVDSEIPSPAGGTILRILIPEGETVKAGTILAWIGEPGEDVPGAQPLAPEVDSAGAKGVAPAVQEAVEGKPEPQPTTQPVTAGRDRDLGFISPIVARLAQEHQVDLRQINGTGEGGRITKKDVLLFVNQRGNGEQKAQPAEAAELMPWETPGEGDLFRPTEMVFGKDKQPNQDRAEEQRPARETAQLKQDARPPAQAATPLPEPPASQATGGRLLPLNTMRRKIAEHMEQSVRTAPHVSTFMEADLHRVDAHYRANRPLLARDGVHLTYSAYFAVAAARALRAVPLVNASWREDGIWLHSAVNLGMAVSLGEDGLIVPVIKNADNLSLVGMARAIKDLADRARARALQPEEVRDGTFTITNHGISGSLLATPIINQPQCGILGVGAIQKRVVVTADDAIAIRPMVYLSLTFDHRILDGASADGFLSKIVETLEGWKE